MAEPNSTPRPASPAVAAEETTPLLSTSAPEYVPQGQDDGARLAEISHSPRNGVNRPRYVPNTRSIKILSYISLICSIVTGTFLLGVAVVILYDRYSYYPWYLRDIFPQLGFCVRNPIL